jgi:S1-C subfamily serine protease
MDDVTLLETIERYLDGEMDGAERASFEELRRRSPEVDQAVVEHSFFLQQVDRFEDNRRLKATLNETHMHLAEQGMIKVAAMRGKAKVLYLFNRYKRTAVIAASIAGITALAISALIWQVSPSKPVGKKDYENLNRDIQIINAKVNQVKTQNEVLKQQISNVTDNTKTVSREYRTGGTGFLVDVKGYLFTNFHVIENARYIAVQNSTGKDLQAKVVYRDEQRDIAILKIDDTAFKAPNLIPYGIKKSGSEIAEPVFSLGYPRNDIVYGEGYLAAKTGYNGDTLSVQISINANRGNSGSPIINRNGEIIGVVNARQNSAEGAVFAIQSKYIHKALAQLQKNDTTYQRLKIPTASALRGTDRTQQVKKIMDFVYMVKVN